MAVLSSTVFIAYNSINDSKVEHNNVEYQIEVFSHIKAEFFVSRLLRPNSFSNEVKFGIQLKCGILAITTNIKGKFIDLVNS